MQISKQPNIKSRSGCEQCKRRRVKCDEKRPICTRCLLRKETCTGNFSYDVWQIERPWISHERVPSAPSALENATLRHWYDSACLNMAIFYPPANPLSHALSSWLRHSKALRHTLESVSEAHQHHFLPEKLSSALQTRGLAISSLQKEIARLQLSHTKQQTLLRTTILSSLILFVSSAWLDPSGNDVGIMFLSGISDVIASLADSAPTDTFAFYLFGLYLYCEAFSSFLVPTGTGKSHSSVSAVLVAIQRPPIDSLIHPVTGISSTLCPLISEAGRYFRWVLDSKSICMETFCDLEKRLRDWVPPATVIPQENLLQLAEGYRSIGLIMLYQANATQGQHSTTNLILTQMVLEVMRILKGIPNHNPLLNWVGPLLIIAGPELPAAFAEERALVETKFESLATWTRVQTYNRGLELVREVWELRDLGIEASWLEVMLDKGMSLTIL
ncbi:uncharacterized protein FTOL_12845 [Fusarium torulosum]|uniref:Zn(2)-C6 fungal-type domain-containing protein n=1 Tax=Fusarium torulosum TaxID=33205 RepID=A0AAE8MMN5_9HYPO|nr:uncharacterized protein FTOL_12845 [Fusarium torulosum]